MFTPVLGDSAGEGDVDFFGFELFGEFAGFKGVGALVEQAFNFGFGFVDGGSEEGFLVVGEGTDAFHEAAEFSAFAQELQLDGPEIFGGFRRCDSGDGVVLNGGDLFHFTRLI